MEPSHRTCAYIHLDRLARNIERIKQHLAGHAEIVGVIKGDACGHGAIGVYPTLQKCGIKRFAVGFWPEGAALREAGLKDPIHILSDTSDEELDQLVAYDLMPSVSSVDFAQKLNQAAARAGKIQPIILAFNTGMNRYGFPADDSALPDIRQIAAMEHLAIDGAFTHYPRADEADGQVTQAQLAKYLDVVDKLEAEGIAIPFKQTANSASILLHPDTHLDGVRAGDILYGMNPADEEVWAGKGYEEIITWETYVAMVKTVPAGSEIGYSGTFRTERETRVATIPVGFCDGYSRKFSNGGMVKIRGKLCPIIGLICMDGFMVDVTEVEDVQRGDKVLLLGEELSMAWMAEQLSVSLDEVVCGITARVPRIYVEA